jgi:hypothetical protein
LKKSVCGDVVDAVKSAQAKENGNLNKGRFQVAVLSFGLTA